MMEKRKLKTTLSMANILPVRRKVSMKTPKPTPENLESFSVNNDKPADFDLVNMEQHPPLADQQNISQEEREELRANNSHEIGALVRAEPQQDPFVMDWPNKVKHPEMEEVSKKQTLKNELRNKATYLERYSNSWNLKDRFTTQRQISRLKKEIAREEKKEADARALREWEAKIAVAEPIDKIETETAPQEAAQQAPALEAINHKAIAIERLKKIILDAQKMRIEMAGSGKDFDAAGEGKIHEAIELLAHTTGQHPDEVMKELEGQGYMQAVKPITQKIETDETKPEVREPNIEEFPKIKRHVPYPKSMLTAEDIENRQKIAQALNSQKAESERADQERKKQEEIRIAFAKLEKAAQESQKAAEKSREEEHFRSQAHAYQKAANDQANTWDHFNTGRLDKTRSDMLIEKLESLRRKLKDTARWKMFKRYRLENEIIMLEVEIDSERKDSAQREIPYPAEIPFVDPEAPAKEKSEKERTIETLREAIARAEKVREEIEREKREDEILKQNLLRKLKELKRKAA